ncbi:Zeta-crystallin [Vanrija pseudolonga]|uniref:Zeta-crystallin n=1 Tax=Vanrija pseudolonga TaxID=143232 RepID=A0AAF0YCH0_9TREE|nr:Zeta-crystallin [Vanrija pseudolonga]
MMKAAQFSTFGPPSVLHLVDTPIPTPGPGAIRIRVRAAGVNASDFAKRRGEMDPDLPQRLGYEASGIVDALGEDVSNTQLGDAVYGFAFEASTQAEFAVLGFWAPIPPSLDFVRAAAIPTALETAWRALDALRVGAGDVLLVNGASGSVGAAAAQLALARGARVIGTASAGAHGYLRSLGVEPVTYGDGVEERIRQTAGEEGITKALDVAGNGVLPLLVSLTGDKNKVITVADFASAHSTGVRFSRGDDGRALHSLVEVAPLVEAGRFGVHVGATFALGEVVRAHEVGESGTVKGKIVLVINGSD